MPASERTGVAPASRPARRQETARRHRRRPPPRRHLPDPRPPRPGCDNRAEHRRDRVRERRARRRRRHRIDSGIDQQHREPSPQLLRSARERPQPAPHRLHRTTQPSGDPASSRAGRLRRQRRPDDLDQVPSSRQREHWKEHVRHPTRRAPRPPRTHHHRPGHAPQLPSPSPPPRTQRTITTRTHQPARHQLHLDLDRVRPYRQHSASVRYTALPGRLAKEITGRAFACPPSARCHPKRTARPDRHAPRSVAHTMPHPRRSDEHPQRRGTVRVPPVPARRIVGYAAVYGLAGSSSTCTCTGARRARRVCGAFDGCVSRHRRRHRPRRLRAGWTSRTVKAESRRTSTVLPSGLVTWTP